MKANELMIGDWVYAIDANGEKHPCRANNLEYDYTKKLGDFCVDFYGTGYEAEWPDVAFNVEPIPITPELLERNGFINGEFYAESHIEDWQIMSDCIHLAARSERGWCIDIPCRYIHELQHALRLFKLEKDIIL